MRGPSSDLASNQSSSTQSECMPRESAQDHQARNEPSGTAIATRLRSNGVWVFIGRLFGVSTSALSIFVVARVLEPAEFNRNAAYILQILAPGQLLFLISVAWILALQRMGHGSRELCVLLLTANTLMLAAPPAIWRFGPLGLAPVSSTTIGIWNALAGWYTGSVAGRWTQRDFDTLFAGANSIVRLAALGGS